jgi:hypothetical protein
MSFSCINISRPINGLVQPKINTENLNDPIKLKELQIINKGKFASGDMNMEDTIEKIWKKVKINILLACNTKENPGLLRATRMTSHKNNRKAQVLKMRRS